MKETIKRAFLGAIVFLGTIVFGYIGYTAYNSLATQTDGATITKDIWNDVINKVNTIGASQLGVDQTRQNFVVGTDRILGTTYTNNTGKPILVVLSSTIGTGYFNILINGVINQKGVYSRTSGYAGYNLSFIVPNNSTYSFVITSTSPNVEVWSELR